MTCLLWRNVETSQKYFFKKWSNYWKRWLNSEPNFIALVVFSPHSFSCPFSVTLFTKMLWGCKEQWFYIFLAISPNSVVLAEGTLGAVMSRKSPGSMDGQRRTSTLCRAEGICCWTALRSHTSSMPGPSQGTLQQMQGRLGMVSCWATLLCSSQLLTVFNGNTVLVSLVSAEIPVFLAVSPRTSSPCCSLTLTPAQIYGTHPLPCRAVHPWDQLNGFAGNAGRR